MYWEKPKKSFNNNFDCFAVDSLDPSRSSNSLNKSEDQIEKEHPDSCSLLHLACLTTDICMVELLLQYGANINASDSRGRMPLHICVLGRNFAIAKLLLSRLTFSFSYFFGVHNFLKFPLLGYVILFEQIYSIISLTLVIFPTTMNAPELQGSRSTCCRRRRSHFSSAFISIRYR